MNLILTWQTTTDPRKHGEEYLRANKICVGSVSHEMESERYLIRFYLPQLKPSDIRFKTRDEAKAALEKATNNWFERFR